MKDTSQACKTAGRASQLFPQDDSLRSFLQQCNTSKDWLQGYREIRADSRLVSFEITDSQEGLQREARSIPQSAALVEPTKRVSYSDTVIFYLECVNCF